MSHILYDRGKSLEEAFFFDIDRELMAQLRERLLTKDAAAALADVSGISDPALLADLIQHGITAQNFAALALLPSVEVAWADGEVSPEEQAAVLRAAVAQGLSPDGPGVEILKIWLQKRPSGAMLKAWADYAEALVQTMPADQLARVRIEITAKAKAVAMSSGGFLGLGNKISAKEEEALERFEAALLP